MRIVLVKFVLLLFYFSGCIITGHSLPPTILLDGDEYIIHSNDNYTMQCQSNEPITWTYPNNTNNGSMFSYINITPRRLDDRYLSILNLYNASFVDTGFYYCHEEGSDFENNSTSASFYLYVQDDDRLTVMVSDIETVYTVNQYSEVIIPCKPTSPDVKVKLYRSSDDTESCGVHITNTHASLISIDAPFDPKRGFTYFAKNLNHLDFHYCKFTKGETTTIIDLFIHINPMTTSIAKPYLEDLNLGHTVVGGTLKLKCLLKCTIQFSMNWTYPNKNGNKTGRIYISDITSIDIGTHYRILTIKNVTKEDEGPYSCLVEDYKNKNNNTIYVKIYKTEEHFIHLSEENNVHNISVQAGDPSAQWIIDINAHPISNLTHEWRDNNYELIEYAHTNGRKYETRFTPTEAFLKINNIVINDFGNYTLIVNNGFEKETLKLFLTVTDKPSVHINSKNYHFIGTTSTIECIAAGYPEPKIKWTFKPCLDQKCHNKSITPISVRRNGLQVISTVNIVAIRSGILTCYADNSQGFDIANQSFFVTDVHNGFSIRYSDNVFDEQSTQNKIVAVGDNMELYCGASIYNFTGNIMWNKNGQNIPNDEVYTIERSHTDYSYKTTLILKNVTNQDTGTYLCKAMQNDVNYKQAKISLKVLDPVKPEIFETNIIKPSTAMELPSGFYLKCFTSGIPKPAVVWLKDDIVIKPDNRTNITNNGQILEYRKTVESDEGIYTCLVKNKAGEVFKKTEIFFKNKPTPGAKIYIVIGVLLLIVLICIIVLIAKIMKERKLRSCLRKAGLEHFEHGQIESINPDLGIDDQAELLPYDKKWEFPREKLKLGKQLGSGAFGVVMKAEAEGIVEGEEKTTVAVKMVKRNAESAYIKALTSELKIMVHLGQHVNVVNLLGACTKNVAKRELLVIVEYCRYGNLHNYLMRHRENFIDQIDTNSGKIDYSIGIESLDRSLSFSSNRSNSQSSKSPTVKYIALKFAQSSDQGGHINKVMADYRAGNASSSENVNYSVNTETTTISMAPSGNPDDLMTLSNNSTQPEWRSNYRGDYKGNVRPISTKDLLTWAFQVARGMEYLSSRKVLHGDLAARNILLSENNIVKICDFGLAKSMYKSDNYKKRGDGPLPVKWMSVESIRDRIFSTQSDVWSFGIVLWEFFSLARTPYPGMEADERLYQKLLDGYRMDIPNFATKEIYEMMLQCWEAKPQDRPTFTELACKIGIFLEDTVRQFYIDLNDPYLVMNTNRIEDGRSDYLLMCSPPDFENLSSPQHYINEETGENLQNGYMCMKPGQIFSPRDRNETVFTFDVDKKNNQVESPELSPLVRNKSNSEIEATTPEIGSTSFANPSYHMLPDLVGVDKGEILQSADNYVNMPKNKSIVINNSVQKNEQTDIPYVNSTSRDWERVRV